MDTLVEGEAVTPAVPPARLSLVRWWPLLLYPLYLHLFTSHLVPVDAGMIGGPLSHWFLLPLTVAVTAHYGLRRVPADVYGDAANPTLL